MGGIMDRNSPIGLFDSGIGGVSVMRELYSLMPNENYICYGDSANAPYGTKTSSEVLALSLKSAEILYKRGVKAIVIACNTATSASAYELRRIYDIPIIGLEPAVKPAALSSPHPTVLVMATELTLKLPKYLELVSRFERRADFIPLPAPGIVELVEQGYTSGIRLEEYLNGLFEPYRSMKIDAIVLGCTHFPLVKDTIRKCFGTEIMIFDGGKGAAKETKRLLEERNMLAEADRRGTVVFENSLSESVAKRAEALFLANLSESVNNPARG